MSLLIKPPFWTERSVLAWLLWPVSGLYRIGYALDHLIKTPSISQDGEYIICVGNITAGGTGKTPIVMALYNHFKDHNPVILSKGYKATEKGPLYVRAHDHTAQDIGDEPLMMARRDMNVIIGRQRAKALEFARAQGHRLFIMDDGLQSPRIKADYNICVIDGEYGLGNGFCLPAGPLRQPLSSAVKNISRFFVYGTAGDDIKAHTPPITAASFTLDGAADEHKKYIAFAGIGSPHKFFNSLHSNGYNVVDTVIYPDHYPYGAMDIEQLKTKAQAQNATLVTTEKDAVKWSQHADIHIARGRAEFDIPEDLQHAVDITFKAQEAE